ncbi:MAG TPA: tetratricopeptide repeat protein [Roseiarcus sp.]|nr:tetratricopeptide repeat protein [Roseiarcus sp.]
MARDQQGLVLAGAPESAAAFDRAMADYYGLTGDPVGVLKSALARDPGFALGGIAIGALTMIGGFRGDHPEVMSALRAAEAGIGRSSEREQNHLAAAKAWARGEFSQAILGWERILADHPTDALALRLVQDAYFFLGRSAAIRDCAERVMPAWGRDNPLAGFVLGLYAFGLEETGDLKRAEDFGREALARNRRDAWATHALAHVMETANRHEEGVAFLKSTRADWAHAHFMAHHNGWHLALFLIEQGRFDEVLADYDRYTAPKLSDDATLDRVDASSLLWRLELAGVDVGDRWAPVANTWMAHVDDHLLAFNDLHCAFAAARSPEPDHAARLRQSLDEYERTGSGENRQVTSETGRRLIDGVLAFAGRDYGRAVDAIQPVRSDAGRIGGSHAQRDVINLTLIAAAQRSGQASLARALLAERGRSVPDL